jgi:hypothetical protein
MPYPHAPQKSSRVPSGVFVFFVVAVVAVAIADQVRVWRTLARPPDPEVSSAPYDSICFCEPEPIEIFFGFASAGFGMCTSSTPLT